MNEGAYNPGEEFALPIKGEQEPETDTRVADVIREAFSPEQEVAISHSIRLTLDANTGRLTELRERFIQVHSAAVAAPVTAFNFRSEQSSDSGLIEFADLKIQEAFEAYLTNENISWDEGVGHLIFKPLKFELKQGISFSELLKDFVDQYKERHSWANDNDFTRSVTQVNSAIEIEFHQLEIQKAFESYLIDRQDLIKTLI